MSVGFSFEKNDWPEERALGGIGDVPVAVVFLAHARILQRFVKTVNSFGISSTNRESFSPTDNVP